MSSPWSDIAQRAQKARGADRQLDLDIGLAAGLCRRLDADWIAWDGDTYPDHPGSLYPAITESVDAVLDLIGEKFPEWSWRYEDAIGTATLVPDDFDPHKDTPVYDSGVCATPALALLAAFALAMEAQA